MVLQRILFALPSQDAFSLHLFIECWNQFGKTPRIDPGFADVAALAEGIVCNLQLKQYVNGPPVLTEYLGYFKCPKCRKDHNGVQKWECQVFTAIPLLQLPDAPHQTADISAILDDHINEPFETRCVVTKAADKESILASYHLRLDTSQSWQLTDLTIQLEND